jgi:hypothetical protein
MQHPGFFECAGPFALRDIAEKVGAVLTREEYGSRMIRDVWTLRSAGPDDLSSKIANTPVNLWSPWLGPVFWLGPMRNEHPAPRRR